MPRFTAILTGVLRRNTRSKVTIQSIGILQPCRKGNKTVNCVKLTFTNNGVTWIWVQIFNLCCGILNRSIPYALCLFCNRLEMMSKCGKNLKSGAAECVIDDVTTFWRPLWRKTPDPPSQGVLPRMFGQILAQRVYEITNINICSSLSSR